MNKKQWAACFPGEDPGMLARLFTLIEDAFDGIKGVSNEFFPPALCKKIEELPGGLPEGALFYAPADAPHKVFASSLAEAQAGVSLLKIQDGYPKDPLKHKDYLGALMSLGLKREKFSDLWLDGEVCYLPVVRSLADFVMQEMTRVGRHSVRIESLPIEAWGTLKDPRVEEVLLVASLRLDAIIARMGNLSRGKAVQAIETGLVKQNDRVETSSKKDVRKGDVLSLRGKGKIEVGDVLGTTRKGALHLQILRYR
ncbi:hypothetical protein ABB02_01997 [Clostridiaceae bacterium JG1575]|nr:hypothetical protein ABB02_01997 [Clostridiaceae bacterium JG1575]